MKQFAFILSLVLCLSTVTFAQSTSRADELMQQAQTNLKQKEYIKARYLFLQAYNAFSSQEKYDKAVECGVNASALYHRENYYKEAFELLRGAELLVTGGEQKSGKAMPDLRFRINKERLQMYINLKNPARAKEQLTKLEETAKAAKNDSLNNDLLYTQANYYYTFGMNSQGDCTYIGAVCESVPPNEKIRNMPPRQKKGGKPCAVRSTRRGASVSRQSSAVHSISGRATK